MDFHQDTQDLIDRMCRNVERKDFELNKKLAEDCILRTYDIFNLERPKKVIWCKDILDKVFEPSARLARLARSARSARLASSARLARSASSAVAAWSARSARSARATWAAWSASSARAAWSSWSSWGDWQALDYDFDWYVFEFEYCKSNTDFNENDEKYLDYCELLMQAKEAGLGYGLEREDTLYLVPTPLVLLDSQNSFSSMDKPAIRWKDGAEFYFINGVNFEKKLWEKVVSKKLPALDILKLENMEQRYIALKIYGAENLLKELDARLIDGKTKMGNELFEIAGILDKPLKLLRYQCPSTDREYVKFVPFEHTTADGAQAWSHNFKLEEYYSLEAQS